MLESIPAGGWFVIVFVAFCAAIGGMVTITRKGSEYGLRLFRSKQFGLLFLGFICLLLSFGGYEEGMTEAEGLSHVSWGLGAYGIAFVIALIMNIKKSNPVFGIIFSLLQAFMSVFSFLGIIVLIGNLGDWKERRRDAALN